MLAIFRSSGAADGGRTVASRVSGEPGDMLVAEGVAPAALLRAALHRIGEVLHVKSSDDDSTSWMNY
jgi:hypothetical protein